MVRNHFTALLAAVPFLAALPAGAQVGNGGQVELGGYGHYSSYDGTNLGLTREFGGGGRLGIFLSRLWSFELSGDHTRTDAGVPVDRVLVTRLAATPTLNLRLTGTMAAYVGAGYELSAYRGTYDKSESGVVGVLGSRFPLGQRAAFRAEMRASFYPSTSLIGPSSSALNVGFNAGFSIFTFGGPLRDRDTDGVVDRRDRCDETPLGASVDQAGCPADSDNDTYLDGLDQCPATPAGAAVDQVGCPTDQDADHVFDGIDVCPDTPPGATVDENGCPSDADSDGVFNGIDRCPDTPAGATVDPSGCPADGDGDGVPDGIDQCPATAAGAAVDARGCATDQDGDGVADSVDQCPNTPAGTTVNATGCPLDTDGDGVPDSSDQCPNTPAGTPVDVTGCTMQSDVDNDGVDDLRDRCPQTRPGQQVDAVGCAILFRMEEGRARALVLQGVSFQSARSSLTTDSYVILDEVAASLEAHPEVRVEISGHSDATGSREGNMRLSLARAMAVRAYLAQKGIDPNRMVARGYGPDRPVAPNTTRDGRAQNRRVELEVTEGQNQ
ncbi:MAG TPA: OmpA family protein [Gemmatimonadales bacterium]